MGLLWLTGLRDAYNPSWWGRLGGRSKRQPACHMISTSKKQKELMASLSPFSVNLGAQHVVLQIQGVFLHLNSPNLKTFLRDTPKEVFHDDSKASQADIRWSSSPILSPLYLPPQWQEHWQHGAEEGKDLHQI